MLRFSTSCVSIDSLILLKSSIISDFELEHIHKNWVIGAYFCSVDIHYSIPIFFKMSFSSPLSSSLNGSNGFLGGQPGRSSIFIASLKMVMYIVPLCSSLSFRTRSKYGNIFLWIWFTLPQSAFIVQSIEFLLAYSNGMQIVVMINRYGEANLELFLILTSIPCVVLYLFWNTQKKGRIIRISSKNWKRINYHINP